MALHAGIALICSCVSPDPSRAAAAGPAPQTSAPTPTPVAAPPASPDPGVAAVDTEPRPISTEGFPKPVQDHTAVWTGEVVVFWGGDEAFPKEVDGYAPVRPIAHADGAHYDPAADVWSTMPAAPIAGRFDHVAVWTGNEMLVWGGRDAARTLGDGAAYDPRSGRWRRLSKAGGPKARTRPGFAWTGSELVIVGGQDLEGKPVPGAHAYDPVADRWRPLGKLPPRAPHGVVWTGSELIAWGGAPASAPAGVRLADGGTWRALPTKGAPTPAAQSVVAYAGGRLIVWGGRIGDGDPSAAGARFDPQTDQWTAMSPTGAIARMSPEFVVFGDVVAIVGEPVESGGSMDSLSLYNVTDDRWWATPGPYPSFGIAMAWTGTELVAWGGHDGTNMSPSGERVRLR